MKRFAECLTSTICDYKTMEAFDCNLKKTKTCHVSKSPIFDYSLSTPIGTILEFLGETNGDLAILKENLISRCFQYTKTIMEFIDDLIEDNPWPLCLHFPNMGYNHYVVKTKPEIQSLLIACFETTGFLLRDKANGIDPNFVNECRLEVV
jgi:hypothetical protein